MDKKRSLPSPSLFDIPPIDYTVSGPPIPAMDRLKLFSPNDWENFVLECIETQYEMVEKPAGAGDMGRDVIATISNDPDVWDNYQCKHYNHPLMPSDIWIELGKLVYYTYKGEFSFPRKYYFAAPQDVGTTLIKLFKNPDVLKNKLIESWNTHCKSKIITNYEILLEGELLSYLTNLDFSTISYIPAQRLIDEHRKTPWHIARFGGGLPRRPTIPEPPSEPEDIELTYLTKLFDAYTDFKSSPIKSVADILEIKSLLRHYNKTRKQFYSAESLRTFSRDTLPPGTFEKLQDEIFDGIEDILNGHYDNGYDRLIAVVDKSLNLQLTSNPLVPRLEVRDRGGICHQLANESDDVSWVQ